MHSECVGSPERGRAIRRRREGPEGRGIDYDDLLTNLRGLVTYRTEHLTGDEKGESQVFLDRLFRAFGHQGYAEAGAKLEMRIKKQDNRGTSFADLVWKPRVLVEMKKAGTDLSKHYRQAFDYWVRAVPDRPRYVVLCNFDELWVYDFDRQLDEPVDRVKLLDLPRRWEIFGFLLPVERPAQFTNDVVEVTRDSAAKLARLFNALVTRGVEREVAQRFVLQAVMAMFAEDIQLLPAHHFTRAANDALESGNSYDLIFGLFTAMKTVGTTAGGRYEGTPYFNGGLYSTITPFELTPNELKDLAEACATNWSKVRPEIFGTLFEQSLDREERHAYGAHYTNPADIAKIVGPCLVQPWREKIEAAKTVGPLRALHQQLSAVRVLDPACGCGNFLYVAYREMRRIERELIDRIEELDRTGGGGQTVLPLVSPEQFHGIDIRPFAVDVAKVTLMVAKKLAADELGDSQEVLPLENLDDNVIAADALLVDWPRADVVIGNPPYLGRRKVIEERGAAYADQLARRYPMVAGVADYVCYWFSRTQDHLPAGGRAGMVATNSIRQGDSRKASLDYITDHGATLIEAVSTQPWSGEAAVHVSVVNWVNGEYPGPKVLWVDEGKTRLEQPTLNTALSIEVDLRAAVALGINKRPKRVHQGQTPGVTTGFEVDQATAALLRAAEPGSKAVVHPFVGGHQLLHEQHVVRAVIDVPTTDADTAWSQAPTAMRHLEQLVLPVRQEAAGREARRTAEVLAANPAARPNRHHARFLDIWWRHAYRREELMSALDGMERYIAVARVSSQQRTTVFTFVDAAVHPGDTAVAFTLDDDYSLGILQSAAHLAWFKERCTRLKSDLTYTSGAVFNTFPWPQIPTAAAVAAVVDTSAAITEHRAASLTAGQSLAQQYDVLRRPGRSTLRTLHERLDAAVLAAYDFDPAVDTLAQLLSLNLATAAHEVAGEPITPPGPPGPGCRRTTWAYGAAAAAGAR